MTTRERDIASKKIIEALINDLSDRSGLGDEWDQIDEETEQEIKKEWLAIVKRFMPIEVKK